MRKYPSGIMRGKRIIDMSDSQIIAIYNRVINYIPKNKNIPGQLSLFEGDNSYEN